MESTFFMKLVPWTPLTEVGTIRRASRERGGGEFSLHARLEFDLSRARFFFSCTGM